MFILIIRKRSKKIVEGVEENLFIHQQVKPKSDYVIYLDIKNAYGSISPELIKKVLKYYNFPERWIEQIADHIDCRYIIYPFSKKKGARSSKKEKKEQKICRWNCGLTQGLAISNYIFILCMEYIIKRTYQKFPLKKCGVEVNGDHFSMQVFCDDIVIYGTYKKKKIIQKMLNYMTKLIRNFGMELNTKKSSIDYVRSYKTEKLLPPPSFSVFDVNLNPTANATLNAVANDFKYLGQYAKTRR